MDDKNSLRRIPLSILMALGVVVITSGGSAAWFTWRMLNPQPPVAEFPSLETEPEIGSEFPDTLANSEASKPAAESDKQPDASATSQETPSQVYWLKNADGRLILTPEAVTLSGENASAQLEGAMQRLLSKSGNPAQDAFTAIPEATQLLALSMEEDGVHIDLSANFQDGGGSASMIGRLGQIIYTVTALEPNAPVWISVESKPLTLLGGEGLEISQPMTRQDFEEFFEL